MRLTLLHSVNGIVMDEALSSSKYNAEDYAKELAMSKGNSKYRL
jgi:hypothetical protein